MISKAKVRHHNTKEVQVRSSEQTDSSSAGVVVAADDVHNHDSHHNGRMINPMR